MKNKKRHWPVVFGGFVVAVLPCIGVPAADAVTKFSEAQWVNYVKVMKPRAPMPFWALRDTTNEDLAAMYQYIVSLGAAGAPTPDFVPPGQEPKPPYETRRLVQ